MVSCTRRSAAAVCAAALAAALGLLGASPPPPAAVAVRGLPQDGAVRDGDWSVAPGAGGGTRPSADGRPYVHLHGGPGAVLQDTLSVTNPGDRPRTVTLRGADMYNKGTGALALRGRGDSTGVGSWVTLASESVKVPARTRADIPFTVTVPEDAAPGDHPGAVVAAAEGAGSADVRLVLRVSGPTLSSIAVEGVTVAEAGGGSGAEIRYALVNRGNVVLRPRVAVRTDGFFGEPLRGRARALPVELLPGQRIRLSEPWPDAPALDVSDVELTATAPGGARDSASARHTALPQPWTALTLVLLALAAALTSVHLIRRHRAGAAKGAGS